MATVKEMQAAGTIKFEGVGNGQYLIEATRFDPDTGLELPNKNRQYVTVGGLKEKKSELLTQIEDIETALEAIDQCDNTLKETKQAKRKSKKE